MLKKIAHETHLKTSWEHALGSLHQSATSNYISLRLLAHLEPLATIQVEMMHAITVVETSLKSFYISRIKPEDVTAELMKIGHNIETLRRSCADFDPLFAKSDIADFTKHLNDKSGEISQKIKYGFGKNNIGFEANFEKVIPVIDNIYFNSLFLHEKHHQYWLLYSNSLWHLVMKTKFNMFKNPELINQALSLNNQIWGNFCNLCHEYFESIHPDDRQLYF